ncbi:serine hydrolase [Nonomuraea sp. NPDC000554]|uniref:serine hydrolase n=1 Tax=Nonomuraea sp. NPDC000554 TaxID=3154259 RepID=UPI00332DE6AB
MVWGGFARHVLATDGIPARSEWHLHGFRSGPRCQRSGPSTCGRGALSLPRNDLTTWSAGASPEELARVAELLLTCRAVDPAKGTRTTPRDMAELMRLIWTGEAGPAAACERVRAVMARQLTRHRLASGFRPPAQMASKSGSLLGVVRNEVGVITYPDGQRYAATVFTRTRRDSDEAAINAAIGAAAARAVAVLRDGVS